MTKYNPNCHRYVTLLVILGFSIYRLHLLVEWFLGSVVSLYFREGHYNNVLLLSEQGWGMVLSSINLVFWTYNLFVTVLLQIVTEFLSIDKCES